MSIKVSASTNPPKTIGELTEYIKKLNGTGVDFIHCDVMDGKFVKSKTFGSKVVKFINKLTDKPLDVHLMVEVGEGEYVICDGSSPEYPEMTLAKKNYMP